MNAIIPQAPASPSTLAGVKHHRRSKEEKDAILEEARLSSVHGTAVRLKIDPSQLFHWRKQARIAAKTN